MNFKQFEESNTIGKLRVYISGPITGKENHNREEFQRIKEEINKRGFNAVNPLDITHNNPMVKGLLEDLERNKNYHGGNAESEKERLTKELWSLCMKLDIAELVYCNAVVLLKDWETSRGAILELAIAQQLGLPIFHADSYKQLNTVFNIQKITKSELLG